MLALLLFQATPVAAEESDLITVLAERLRRVRLSPGVTIRKGIVTMGQCKIKRSSGDAGLDAAACEAVRTCAGRPQASRKQFNLCVQQEGEDAMYRLLGERQKAGAGI